ncbi:MAG: hypothetical protein JXB07_11590 [Anaerolineae bacterium]|nr:hypothetical protein [Anaerolineae bacterium]
MTTLVQFLIKTEAGLYVLAAIILIFSVRSLVVARQTQRNTVFGLEKEAARQRQRRSLGTILSLLLLSSGVYIITHIVAPNVSETPIEPTPTPLVFVTQIPTPTEARLLYPTITATPGLPPAAVDSMPSPVAEVSSNGCEIAGATITVPTSGEFVSGQVVVEGQANILDFAQYKFEINGPTTNGNWVVVGTFTVPVIDGFLGTWDSTSLAPGNYTLRLVVIRTDGSFPTPCEVPVMIAGSEGFVAPSPTP